MSELVELYYVVAIYTYITKYWFSNSHSEQKNNNFLVFFYITQWTIYRHAFLYFNSSFHIFNRNFIFHPSIAIFTWGSEYKYHISEINPNSPKSSNLNTILHTP